METLQQVLDSRYKDQYVTLSNPMIRSRETTTLLESKIEVLAMHYMSKDMREKQKKDANGKDYSVHYVVVPANEIASLMIRERNTKAGGSAYKTIQNAAISMKQKIFIIEDKESKQFLLKSMFGDVAYNNGELYVEFEPSMESYFLNLKQNFSKLKLPILFSFRKNGGFQLYKLLKSYAYSPNLEEIDMSLSQEELPSFQVYWDLTDLKMQAGYIDITQPLLKKEGAKDHPNWKKMEKEEQSPLYKRWSAFYSRVIEPGVKEINEMSDIYVADIIKKLSGHGGKVTGITFVIQHNKAYYERHNSKKVVEKPVTEESIILSDDQKDDFIDELNDIFAEIIKTKDRRAIAEAAGYDIDRIKEVYELSKTSANINNLVGWMITGLKEGYSSNVSSKGKKKGFKDFEQRKYDFEELEKAAVNQ